MRSDRDRLVDVQEAIERIEKYAQKGREAFEADELIQTWIVHHLQIIGEAVQRISEETRAKQPTIPWPKIVGMRNILVHEYFSIDTNIVWAVVEEELTDLKESVQSLLQKMEPEAR